VFEQVQGNRREVPGFVKRLAVAFAVLVSLIAAAVAQGVVVQEFSFQLKNVKPDGRFTVVFNSRSYDPSGGIPDELKANYIRLPKGGVIRKQFLNKKYYCDVKKLVDKLRVEHPNQPHFERLIDKTLKGKRVAPTNAKDLIKTCRFARIGAGTVLVDARPFESRPIPAFLRMFWTKPAPGAVGTFAIVGIPDSDSQVAKDNSTVRNTQPIVNVSFVNDPTPDGLFGYKIVLPTGPVAGVRISVAEVHVTTEGLTLTKKRKTCVKRKKGKCTKSKVKKTNLFWFDTPPCPPSGQFTFEAYYGYAASPPEIKRTSIPCPKYL
jgi:hypothetical protein